MSTSKNTPKGAKQAKPTGAATEAIKVVPKRAGFRRAGFAFPEEGKIIPLSELSEEQLAQLEGEPMLVTTRVQLAAAAGEAEGAAEADPTAAA